MGILAAAALLLALTATAAPLPPAERKRLQRLIDKDRASACPCSPGGMRTSGVPPMLSALAEGCANPAARRSTGKIEADLREWDSANQRVNEAVCDIPSYTLTDGELCRKVNERATRSGRVRDKALQKSLTEQAMVYLQICTNPSAAAPDAPDACPAIEPPPLVGASGSGCSGRARELREARRRLFEDDQRLQHEGLSRIAALLGKVHCRNVVNEYKQARDLQYRSFSRNLDSDLPCGKPR
ncbi:MAG: hypothetical protein HY553_22135 [Elusimicrobia bacterium]|nr:hypothetical protein [Elusimicrobiota bacterium]